MEVNEIEDIVSNCLRTVFEEERSSFWVPAEQHYKDHQMLEICKDRQDEWSKNHEFISEVRNGAALAKRAGIFAVVGTLISFIVGAIWLAIKIKVSASG